MSNDSNPTEAWNKIAQEFGTPFHSFEFCNAIQHSWPSRKESRHTYLYDHSGGVVIPAWRYDHCPRLDYYRAAIPTLQFTHPLVVSHALVGWAGHPIATSQEWLVEGISSHEQQCCQDSSASLFLGIEIQNDLARSVLASFGYHIAHFHTKAIKQISPEHLLNPLINCKPRQGSKRRRYWRRAEDLGATTIVGRPLSTEPVIRLLRSGLVRHGVDDSVLSVDYLQNVLDGNLPGIEQVSAIDNRGTILGVNICFHWRDVYYVWLGGIDYAFASSLHPTDGLYQACIKRAAELRCREIDFGRSPYAIKFDYGCSPRRILAAIKGSDRVQHQECVEWLMALSKRHMDIYPELSRLSF